MHALTMRVLPGTIFPLTMGLAVCYAWLLHRQVNLVIGTYLSLSIALFSVLFFERVLPYREEWKAGRREQGQDFLFITLVHLLFTKFLGFAAAMLLFHALDGRHLSFPLWPSHWPVLFQGMLMVLCVDFFRYWLHRACHQNKYLWRLHAVHHSPKRLYWLNVGRFHPAERTLQFLLDSFPFMLIGVQKEVLALYFIIFAVNGFFQHCNIRLHYGFLNGRIEFLLAEANSRVRVRLDANNLWESSSEAVAYLKALPVLPFAIEEPLNAFNSEGLKEIARHVSIKIILDESALHLKHLEAVQGSEEIFVVNLRVSKMGGLIRSLKFAETARRLGFPLIIGAQVGETSILTRAALTVANANRANLLAQEGAYGTLLLESDITPKPLMFAEGGMLDPGGFLQPDCYGFQMRYSI